MICAQVSGRMCATIDITSLLLDLGRSQYQRLRLTYQIVPQYGAHIRITPADKTWIGIITIKEIIAARLAASGLFAPNSLPTLVPTATEMPRGVMNVSPMVDSMMVMVSKLRG